jgi:hypothetical protein
MTLDVVAEIKESVAVCSFLLLLVNGATVELVK